MPREDLPFDPAHVRCIYPEFGRAFSQMLDQSGKRPIEVARAVGISAEIVRGYRRGFVKPAPNTLRKLEDYFGGPIAPVPSPSPELSLPGTMTLGRHPSGDLLVTFRLAPGKIAQFLSKLTEP